MSATNSSAQTTTTTPVESASVPKIALRGVTRAFGGVRAVDDVNLDIEDGEFVVLVGPSGCGKSTLLRMIAGLQPVTSGTIEIEGVEAQDSEPDERDLAFVFQSYALYPHMTVRRNMSFPLLMRRFRWWHHIPGVGWWRRRTVERSPEVCETIDRIANVLGLQDHLDRMPSTLSGGQRQRVALGRAMVREPLAFLMDEPLSNLDAKLRAQTRSELIKFHQVLNTTIIYVTHDQVEAMTMGDKIGVMLDGRLQQFGTPRDVYENPANTFVAQFIGTPAMNLLPARLVDGHWAVADQNLPAVDELLDLTARTCEEHGEFLLGIRSEWVTLADPTEEGVLRGRVSSVEDWGAEQLVKVDLAADRHRDDQSVLDPDQYVLDVRVPSQRVLHVGDVVGLKVSTTDARAFDPSTGESLTPAQKGSTALTPA